jgi:hypothetical protein
MGVAQPQLSHDHDPLAVAAAGLMIMRDCPVVIYGLFMSRVKCL